MRGRALLAMLLLAPLAAAQETPPASVPTDLFIHIVNVHDAPINTQEPASGWTEDAMFGPAPTLRCLHGTTGDPFGVGVGTAGTTNQAFHTWRGYGTPSNVEYQQAAADGSPRMHSARGVWGNVSIDPTAPMALHWFLRATHGDAAAPAVPNVLVRAAVRAGDHISVDDGAYDRGRLLFSGEAGPATLANGEVLPADGARGSVVAVRQDDAGWIYEFIVPLDASDPVLAMAEGYNLRVDVLMEAPGCDDPDATLMPAGVAMHTSVGLRPRLAWSVLDPLAPGHAAVGFHSETGRPWISAEAATVFGPQDVKNVEITFERVERDGTRTALRLVEHVVQGYGPCGHDCGHTQETRYSLEQHDLSPGTYELTLSYDNLQGTAHRQSSAVLVVEPAAEAPGLGAAGVGAALLALALLLCRR